MKRILLCTLALCFTLNSANACRTWGSYDSQADEMVIKFSDDNDSNENLVDRFMGQNIRNKTCEDVINTFNIPTTVLITGETKPVRIQFVNDSGRNYKNLPSLSESFFTIIKNDNAKKNQIEDLETECKRAKKESEKHVTEVLKGIIISSKGCKVNIQELTGSIEGGYLPSNKTETSYEIIFK